MQPGMYTSWHKTNNSVPPLPLHHVHDMASRPVPWVTKLVYTSKAKRRWRENVCTWISESCSWLSWPALLNNAQCVFGPIDHAPCSLETSSCRLTSCGLPAHNHLLIWLNESNCDHTKSHFRVKLSCFFCNDCVWEKVFWGKCASRDQWLLVQNRLAAMCSVPGGLTQTWILWY